MKASDNEPQFSNVDEYLAALPEKLRETLEKLRQTIKNAAPEAEEVISYQMPAFKFHGMLVYFAAFSNHYSLFVNPAVLQVFKGELKAYSLSKSAIRFSLDTPVQVELVTKIVQFGIIENLKKAELKTKRKNK
jgi:uncharacterized protein YdhG (YjbR/CyaY superfamily)